MGRSRAVTVSHAAVSAVPDRPIFLVRHRRLPKAVGVTSLSGVGVTFRHSPRHPMVVAAVNNRPIPAMVVVNNHLIPAPSLG